MQRELDAEAEAAAIARASELEKELHEKLYHKAMLFYYLQAFKEERVRMEEPIGWRPVLDPNVPMEEHVRILQARRRPVE
jgi:hypothetical protein